MEYCAEVNAGCAGKRSAISQSSRRRNKSAGHQSGVKNVTRDTDYFRRRAAEARAAARMKDEPERVEIAGELALAYAALARRRAKVNATAEEFPAIPLEQPA
jgi:hypothetical protein